MKAISELDAKSYRLYINQGGWKTMDPNRMLIVLDKLKELPWLDRSREERINKTIDAIHEKLRSGIPQRNGV